MTKVYVLRQSAVTSSERLGVYDNFEAAKEHAMDVVDDSWTVHDEADQFMAASGQGRIEIEEFDVQSEYNGAASGH